GRGISTLPSLPAGSDATAQSAVTHSTLSNSPLVSTPQMYGKLAFTDAGAHPRNAIVRVSITLRYNHQNELDELVAKLSGPQAGSHRRFLSPQEFNAKYAPTPEQERSVIRALQTAGFKIEKRYANRTILAATARTSAVESFFSTEIHTVHQGSYGDRYTNVKAVTVPTSIAPYVRDVSLNNLVVVRTVADETGGGRTAPTFATDSQGRTVIPLKGVKTMDSTGNLVNGGFETGSFSPSWIDESDGSPDARISTAEAHSGTYSALLGSTSPPETYLWSSIAQEVKVPASGKLSFWVYQGSNEGTLGYGTRYAYQAGYLLNSRGSILTTFYKTVNNTNGWVNYTINLSSYAGQTDYIYFGVYGDGYSQTYTYQYVDDVAWVGATPTPSPTPTAKPTATPTAQPTSTPGSGCNGAAPDSGPLTNSDGTLATGVAKPFDFPVQHGCNGAGETAAIVIDDPVNATYTKAYLSAAQVTQTGTVTNEAVDGGGSGDDPETDLDVQTISGLAPGANIVVYDIGSLGDQQIEDAYNQVLTDGKATAVNSSFGGCESSDPSFADSTNSIAEQGASEGVEFSASSGDTGSNECNGSKGVSAPAGGPYFSSIGGVNFTETSQGVLETVTEGSASGDSGGGGVSTVFALPSYQSGITGMITSGRNQPDYS
ncbi:MAG TPA: protease pro-enzyme activation domain-containing protein, partial [Candidatus Acidoferrum sp.]|nr:protease pro-enzyme activation domain-containing protein [Candidatus Acidoferrum sp.]